MSIRKTLLIAFVSVGLVSAVLMAALAFVKAKQAVREEIERSLAVQAKGVSEEIDKMMFERLQNAATWSKLDIMQDVQVRDVDKRLSQFLAGLQAGYGDVYLNLSGIDGDGLVVSSSDVALVGKRVASSTPTFETPSMADSVAFHFDPDPTLRAVDMSIPIHAAFRPGMLGRLQLRLDWMRIEDVLDRAAGMEGRNLALVDAGGRMVAGSVDLRRRGLLMGRTLAGVGEPTGAVSLRHLEAVGRSDSIVASAASTGYAGFAGFGWKTLVMQPVDKAFEPIHRMAIIFSWVLGFIVAFTLLTAVWVSRKISEPIVALTGFARGYVRKKVLGAPPQAGAGEVGELTRAFVSMMRDIEQSQQNLVRASKLAVVGEMSAIIAHEVRTPLGILRSSAQVLRREPNITAEGRELVGFIESETGRLNRLVSAMLDSARPRAASYSSVDVNELIRRSVSMLAGQAAAKGVAISVGDITENGWIDCDVEQITQVVLNILMNGLQILKQGGRIEVSTRDEGRFLCIDMADDGPGIDPTDRARVFEAFFFQREGGIGLGLAIVQQIVASHGGQIEAMESDLGGALFRILLPRTQAGAS